MNARNEKKPAERRGYSEALGGGTPWTSGNSFRRKQLPKHPFSLAASSRIVQAKSRLEPVTNGLCQWRISVSARLGIMSCRRVGCRVGQEGNPHMAKRTTAHHSLLRLASVGLCNSGTGKPTAPLKKRGRLAPRGRPKAVQQDGMCLWSAWEVIGRKPIISADSPEQGGPSCVTTLFLT